MFMGVPVVPFFTGCAIVILMAVWSSNYLLLVFLPIVIFIMRMMAKRDEMVFHLVGLKLLFRIRTRNVGRHGGMWVYTPNDCRRR